MKLFIALVSCLVATSAFATVPDLSKTVLRNVLVDGKPQANHVALVTINEAQKTLSISVLNDICHQYDPATAGQIHCMAMPAPVLTATVPYTVKMDGCRSTIYSGVDDRRPVDGNREEITLVDNTTRICEDVIAGQITVKATSTTARGGKTLTVEAAGNLLTAPVAPVAAKSDDKAIYDALQVAEVALNPGIAGVGRFQKSAGRLVCVRETLVVARAKTTYTCTLN